METNFLGLACSGPGVQHLAHFQRDTFLQQDSTNPGAPSEARNETLNEKLTQNRPAKAATSFGEACPTFDPCQSSWDPEFVTENKLMAIKVERKRGRDKLGGWY